MAEKLIKYYFEKELTYQEICDIINKKHGFKLSKRKVERILSKLGLRRKNVEESPLEDIVTAILLELDSCGYNLGYKSLWLKLKKNYHLLVKRETVYRVLQVADPEGLDIRFGNRLKRRLYLSPGPNFIWHCDGYDKLKPFGFSIHGCVDGFSRFVIWLEVGTTNNDPKVTSYYYLKAIEDLKFVPTMLRCDNGTENVLIGVLQTCLRSKHIDQLSGSKSFIQGKSTRNQRIESFWGRMRKHSMDYYIQLFKCMQQRNLFDGSPLHINCLRYCFGPLIKYDLQQTKILWNEHRIRKQKARNNLHGKPFVMYECPERYGCQDFKKPINANIIPHLINECCTLPKLYDPVFGRRVNQLFQNPTIPATSQEALTLYKSILERY